MDNERVEMLWKSITMIEAQEQLKAFEASDWSNQNNASRKKKHKDLFKQAFPNHLQEKNYIDLTDLAKVLGR